MNTESIDTRRVPPGDLEKPGDFCFDEERNYIYVWLPGFSGPDAIRIQKGESPGGRIWGWDGNELKPTLTPSIHAPGEWHGFLRNGRLQSC